MWSGLRVGSPRSWCWQDWFLFRPWLLAFPLERMGPWCLPSFAQFTLLLPIFKLLHIVSLGTFLIFCCDYSLLDSWIICVPFWQSSEENQVLIMCPIFHVSLKVLKTTEVTSTPQLPLPPASLMALLSWKPWAALVATHGLYPYSVGTTPSTHTQTAQTQGMATLPSSSLLLPERALTLPTHPDSPNSGDGHLTSLNCQISPLKILGFCWGKGPDCFSFTFSASVYFCPSI